MSSLRSGEPYTGIELHVRPLHHQWKRHARSLEAPALDCSYQFGFLELVWYSNLDAGQQSGAVGTAAVPYFRRELSIRRGTTLRVRS
jgi:hypothetical protein